MMIFYFYLVCFTLYISIQCFHLVYVFQFVSFLLLFFFLKPLANVVEKLLYTYVYKWNFPGSSKSKVSACNAEDLGLIPGWGKSPGEGHGNPLWYSCLENSMDRGTWWGLKEGAHGVSKSQTQLSNLHTHSHTHTYK